MYHSVYYGSYNSWNTWCLVPSERPSIAPPEIYTPYDDFKDGLGAIDLDLLTNNDMEMVGRSGTHQWIIDTFEREDRGMEWFDVYSSILQKIHGKKMQIILEDEPNYYYYGRVSVKDYKAEASHSTLSIDYLVEPYKYDLAKTTHSITFNSESGAAKTITNPGKYITPVVVTITPLQSFNSLSLSGLARNVKIPSKAVGISLYNLEQNVPIVIDGIKCTVTRGGENIFGTDAVLTNFPTLVAGSNAIRVTSGVSTLKQGFRMDIEYNARYL